MAFTGGSQPSGGGLGAMAGVVMVFIGLIVVTAIQQFAPSIGGSIEQAQRSTDLKETCWVCDETSACTQIYRDCTGDPAENVTVFSEWNTTHNTDIPTGADTYASNAQMGNLLVLIIIVSLILAYLIRI